MVDTGKKGTRLKDFGQMILGSLVAFNIYATPTRAFNWLAVIIAIILITLIGIIIIYRQPKYTPHFLASIAIAFLIALLFAIPYGYYPWEYGDPLLMYLTVALIVSPTVILFDVIFD